MVKVASGQTLRSAERLLKVLKCFDCDQAVLGIAEISERLELAPSTVRRLLQTLEGEGFVRLEVEGGGYRLHTALIRLAASALAGSSLVGLATPKLDRLSETLGESVHLSLLDGSEVLLIDRRPGRHMMRAERPIGHRYPAYRGSAAGKALLAWLPDPRLQALLPSSGRWEATTERGIGDRAALDSALAQTRQRGFGLNDGETEPGVWAVAAPLRDQRGDVVAALSVPCPTSRLTDDRRSLIVAEVSEAAGSLSAAVPFAA